MSEIFCCVYCGASSGNRIVTDKVKGDRTGTLCVCECVLCGHVQLHPPFYSEDFYEDDGQVNNVIRQYGTPFETLIEHSQIEASRRTERLGRKTSDALPESSGSYKILDVGGGYGFFGKAIAEKYSRSSVTVLEPSESRIAKGKALIGDDNIPDNLVFSSRYLDVEFVAEHGASFDLVTMWHVLEHVTQPIELLRNAFALLRPGGVLCVEVPNHADELIQLSTGFRERSYIVEHISYFSPIVLERAMKTASIDAVIDVAGYQRYGIFNYFHWLYFNRPQGEAPDLFAGHDRVWLEKTWRSVREAARTSDALYMTARKPIKTNDFQQS